MGVQPAGASVVRVSVTDPEKFAAGVYVTEAGLAVAAVLLNVPPPLVMDHVPVVAPPPIEEPPSVIGAGVADWQTTSSVPAFTVDAGFITMVRVALTGVQGPEASVVNVSVTVPEKLAAGVYVTAAGLLD
jgi:hypothetical protein